MNALERKTQQILAEKNPGEKPRVVLALPEKNPDFQKVLTKGETRFFIKYWRLGKRRIASKAFKNPTLVEAISACNTLLQKHGVLFLEGTEPTPNGIELILGS